MADLSKTVEIIFGASDNTGAAFKSLDTKLHTIDRAVQAVAEPLADAANAVLKLDGILLALAGTLTTVSVKVAGEFQQSVGEIGSLFNATEEQTGQLSQAILDYSRSSTSSIQDINAAAYIAISTGTEWADVTKQLAIAEQLAAVGATSLENATALLSRTMNGYGAEATDAERYSDALFVTVQKGDTTMAALAQAMGRVVSSASAANIPIETLGAATATLTSSGVLTNEAMTLLNSLFKELLNPSQALNTALGGMNLENNSLYEITQKLATATGGAADEFFNLFGRAEAARAAIILSSTGSELFTKTLTAMDDKLGSVTANYEAMASTYGKINQKLVNNIEANLIGIGIPLLDEYGDAIGALTSIFNTLGDEWNAEGAFGPLFLLIDESADKLVEYLRGIAAVLPDALEELDLSGLIEALQDLGGEIEKVFISLLGEEFDITTVEGMTSALQRGVDLLRILANLTTGIISQFQTVFSAIGTGTSALLESSDNDLEKLIGKFLGAGKALVEFGTYIGSAILTFNAAVDDTRAGMNVLIGALRIFTNAIELVWNGFGGTLALVISEFYRSIAAVSNLTGVGDTDAFTQAFEKYQKIAEDAKDAFLSDIGDMGDAWSQMTGGLDQGADEAKVSINGFAGAVGDSGASVDKTKGKVIDLTKVVSELSVKLKAQGIEWDSTSGKLAETKTGVEAVTWDMVKFGETTEQAALRIQKSFNDIEIGKMFAEAGFGFDKATESVLRTAKAGEDLNTVYTDAYGNIRIVTKSTNELTESEDALAKKTAEARKEARDWELQMEKIASNERIALIEAKVALNVAEVEADTQKVIAAFESINAVIDATSRVIASALGSLTDVGANTRTWNVIVDQLEKENELRDAALEKQSELIDSQIAYNQAKIESLAKGEALIKVEGDGLKPHMEAFMYELLENIQIRASEEGEEWLLGCTA